MFFEATQSQFVPQATPAALDDGSSSVANAPSIAFSTRQEAGARLPMLRHLLLQAPLTPEALAVAAAARTNGLPVTITEAGIEDLPRFAPHLPAGGCLPVGTPEFMRSAKHLAGIPPADWVRYPSQLSAFLLLPARCVNVSAALAVRRPVIISPHSGSPFAPFLLPHESVMNRDSHAHLVRVLDLPAATQVCVAAAKEIIATWRYYVVHGEVVGFARSLQHHGDPAMRPDFEDVSAMVAAAPDNTAYVLDVGLLRDGASTLLGVQDPLDAQLLRTGENRPSNSDFLRMLWVRWRELVSAARSGAASMEPNTGV